MVESGALDLTRAERPGAPPTHLGRLGRGYVHGEISCMFGVPARADAVAVNPGSGIGYDSKVGTRIRVGIVGRRVSPLGDLRGASRARDGCSRRARAAARTRRVRSVPLRVGGVRRVGGDAAGTPGGESRASRGGRAGRARRGRARPTEDGDGTVHARAAGQRERHAVGEDREDANARARKGGGGGAAAGGASERRCETPKTREGAPRNANARRGRGTPRGARARERKKPKSKDERRSGRGRIGWTRRGFDASAPRTPPSRLPI